MTKPKSKIKTKAKSKIAQKKYEQSLKKKGLARLTIIIPDGEVETFKTQAATKRLEHQLDLFKKAK